MNNWDETWDRDPWTIPVRAYCPRCGHPLGIGGECSFCAARQLEDIEYKHSVFIKTRTLSWWRDYWKSAVDVLEGVLKRPATMPEKLAMLKRWKVNFRAWGSPGSYTTLAMLTHLMDIQDG